MTADEMKRDYYSKYREANRDHLRVYKRKWNRANRQKVKEYRERYWQRKAFELSRPP